MGTHPGWIAELDNVLTGRASSPPDARTQDQREEAAGVDGWDLDLSNGNWSGRSDDDEAMRDSLQFLLDSADFEVSLFDSAQTFLDQLSTIEIGCVVSDIRMPGVDGRKRVASSAVMQPRRA
jgi:hypothetical protein